MQHTMVDDGWDGRHAQTPNYGRTSNSGSGRDPNGSWKI